MGVIAARQFANRHERAVCTLRARGYRSGPLSLSRFNRRFHALAHRLSDGHHLHHQLAAAARLRARPCRALSQGAGSGVLRLLCRQANDGGPLGGIRLALASDRRRRRCAGLVRPAARVVSRPHAAAERMCAPGEGVLGAAEQVGGHHNRRRLGLQRDVNGVDRADERIPSLGPTTSEQGEDVASCQRRAGAARRAGRAGSDLLREDRAGGAQPVGEGVGEDRRGARPPATSALQRGWRHRGAREPMQHIP